eukprot:CAMPEP_0119344648 /NCGR_PEP_ID=MMETSP1333-20130426/107078_1 /TAXON_ID=418940 /ORGANISM="Scyphosphaera apsteinii, Strain RCC1455" /LENGTH=375 /DNA_ID=CAMNT_0007357089 /DNA_START=13 /DNA_END=1141 /DNA_ORIENTATION=-
MQAGFSSRGRTFYFALKLVQLHGCLWHTCEKMCGGTGKDEAAASRQLANNYTTFCATACTPRPRSNQAQPTSALQAGTVLTVSTSTESTLEDSIAKIFGSNASVRPRVTLVSFADGAVYEKSLHMLRQQVWADRKMLWTDVQLRQDPLFIEHSHLFSKLADITNSYPLLGHKQQRPYCDAFKPIMILAAMRKSSRPRDYVLWTDSSKYNLPRLGAEDLLRALHMLGGRSMTALLHCGCDCTTLSERYMSQTRLISRVTADLYAEIVPRPVLFSTHGLLATHLLWAVTDENKRLAEAWLQLAINHPRAFCTSHTQDQAALTVLAVNRSLQVVDTCQFMHPPWLNMRCYDELKVLQSAIGAIARGKFVMRTYLQTDG